MSVTVILKIVLAILLLFATHNAAPLCQAVQEATASALAHADDAHRGHHKAAARAVPLFSGMGSHHFAISTRSTLAQRYFNQGLVLLYAFNHAEAIRSFAEAARLDPTCAMAHWGVALAFGPNINAAMDAAAVPQAMAALDQALAHADRASKKEQALIGALAARYSKDPAADRKALDRAYANAMREVAKRYAKDADVVTLFAESLMDTMPWAYWTKEGKAKPETIEILAALESVLTRHPNHPGANHYYIHAVEASPNPERGVASADRLRDLVPGAGHLVHMPAHIYLRVGRYHDATLANEKAIEADKVYKTQCHALGLYPIAYVPHNQHFLWASATMEGNSKKAMAAAARMAEQIEHKLLRQPGYGTLQHYLITPLYAKVRFAKWDEILQTPAPDADLLYPTGVWQYARGLALAKTGHIAEAENALANLTAVAADPALESVTIWDINTTANLMKVAKAELAGEIAAARGAMTDAIAHLQTAIERQDELTYDEPPPWHYPVRQKLAAVLLKAGRAADAERVYREDLRRNPENGWSLHGLTTSLQAQGKTAEAAATRQRFAKAWAHADVNLDSPPFTDAGSTMPAVKFITLRGRVKLSYVEQGDPTGVPVILLHGFTDSWRSYEMILPLLPRSYRIFALSQRGHSDSGRPETGYHPKHFADDVAAFMKAKGLQSAIIVGHSMGSYVAQRFAIDYPERTRGLVLVGTFLTCRGNPNVQQLWDTVVSKLADPVDVNFIREFQKGTFTKAVSDTFFEAAVRESAKVPARVWRGVIAELMQADFSGELGKIKAPTLIIWGDQDAFFFSRSEQERLAASISGARLMIYQGVGHAPHWEDPTRFAHDLTAFFEGLKH